MKRKIAHFQSMQQGVVLIEAMVAILLFSVGVLAIAGLQASMIQNTSDTKLRAEAGYIAQQQIGRMWADSTNAVAGVYNTVTSVSDLPEGVVSVTAPVIANEFVITVGWSSPGDAKTNLANAQPCFLPVDVAHCFSTNATIGSLP